MCFVELNEVRGAKLGKSRIKTNKKQVSELRVLIKCARFMVVNTKVTLIIFWEKFN